MAIDAAVPDNKSFNLQWSQGAASFFDQLSVKLSPLNPDGTKFDFTAGGNYSSPTASLIFEVPTVFGAPVQITTSVGVHTPAVDGITLQMTAGQLNTIGSSAPQLPPGSYKAIVEVIGTGHAVYANQGNINVVAVG